MRLRIILKLQLSQPWTGLQGTGGMGGITLTLIDWGEKFDQHYECVVIAVTSLWPWWRFKSPVSRLFTQPFVLAQIKENTKAPRDWSLWVEFTGDRWIPRTKVQWRRKWFHLMTSSWPSQSKLCNCVARPGWHVLCRNVLYKSIGQTLLIGWS